MDLFLKKAHRIIKIYCLSSAGKYKVYILKNSILHDAIFHVCCVFDKNLRSGFHRVISSCSDTYKFEKYNYFFLFGRRSLTHFRMPPKS